jgi:hypothetical protein
MAVQRLAWLSFALLAGCGTSPDERPATLEVISLSILAPSCGQVQCHSSSTNLQGYAFDTLAGSRAALRKLVGVGGTNKKLMKVLTTDGEERMPADVPMDDQDIALIQAWIDGGAQGL